MLTIPRQFMLALTGLFAIGWCSACADDAEAVKEKLYQAKKEYDTAVQKYKKSVIDLLDKREDDARKAAKVKTVDQVKLEREVFEKNGESPSMLPALIHDPIISARTKLDTAFKSAVKEYLRFKLDDAASSTEKDRQDFLVAAALQCGKRTHVAGLRPFDIRVCDGEPFGKDESGYKMNGVAIPHSLFMHGDATGEAYVSYTLAGKAVVFRATIGIPKHLDPQEDPKSPVTFEVVGDKKSLWKSEPVTSLDSFQTCRVCVEKVKILTLRIHCQGSNWWSRAVWFGPIVAE